MNNIQNNPDSAKLENLENKLISINEAKEILRCTREVITGLINDELLIANNRVKQLFLNKADCQLMVIKLTELTYPENFGSNKKNITKYFPARNLKLDGVN
jgi:hypothetical protein